MTTIIKKGYKQTEIGVIPEDWEVFELKTLVDNDRKIRYGIVQPGKFDINGRYMVRGQDYSFGWANEDSFFKVSPEVEERYKNARLKPKDIILTIVGASTGHLEIVPDWLDGANITQTTARIGIDKSKADTKFCKYFFQSVAGQNEIKNYIKGNAQPGLNIRDVEIFKLPLPSIKSEQSAIATVLSDTDALIEHLEKLIVKKRAIKQGTMQQLLTGKKRLSGFDEEWEVKKLGEIFSLSATYSKSKFIDNGGIYLIMDMGSVSSVGKMIATKRTSLHHDLLKIGDLVMPKDDIGGGNIIGKVAYINQENKYILGDHVYKLTSISEIDTLFCSYLINSNIVSSELRKKVAGSAQLGLGRKSVEEQIIRVPKNKTEQSAIATILSDMDREIESLEAKRDKYRAIKQGMMQELLTGKIRILGK